MNHLLDLHPYALAAAIFGLRVVDVSLGTIRTLAVVQGRVRLSVLLGFFEVLIWILAVSQVITGIRDNPVLLVAYAGGFATGNAVGILLERRLALGSVVVRIVSPTSGGAMAAALREGGYALTSFRGEGRDGEVTLLYISCTRRALPGVLEAARRVDPDYFYVVEPAREWGHGMPHPLPHSTGWRAAFQRK